MRGFGYVKIELRITDCPEIDITKIGTKEHTLQNTAAVTQRLGEEGMRCYECHAHACDTCENFELSEIPCFICETLKCKTCKGMAGIGNFDMPFRSVPLVKIVWIAPDAESLICTSLIIRRKNNV